MQSDSVYTALSTSSVPTAAPLLSLCAIGRSELPRGLCAKYLHYPECWDTAAYPTLESAILEVLAGFRCTNPDTYAAAGKLSSLIDAFETAVYLDTASYGYDANHRRRVHETKDALMTAMSPLLNACQAMDAHYSGSLDHQPAYVRIARAAIRKVVEE